MVCFTSKQAKANSFFFIVQCNSYTITEFFVVRIETNFFYKKFGLSLRIRIPRFYEIRTTIFTEEYIKNDCLPRLTTKKTSVIPMYS